MRGFPLFGGGYWVADRRGLVRTGLGIAFSRMLDTHHTAMSPLPLGSMQHGAPVFNEPSEPSDILPDTRKLHLLHLLHLHDSLELLLDLEAL